MKRFLITVFLFFILCGVINYWLNYDLTYTWGREELHKKHLHFEQEYKKYSTVFIGSSRFYRHVIPELFDSLQADDKVKSFNFADANMFLPETYYFLDNFLQDSLSNSLENIFIELQYVKKINDLNVNTSTVKYYNNLNQLTWVFRYLTNESNQEIKTSEYCLNFIKATFLNYINSNDFFDKLSKKIKPDKKLFDYPIQIKDEGVAFLDTSESKYLKLGHEEFLEKGLQKDSFNYINKLANEQALKYNKFHKATIEYYIEKAKNKGIKLIFVLTPRQKAVMYYSTIPLFKVLPEEHKISIASPKQFPELFLLENSFDQYHLNKKGALKFTEYLSKEYDKMKSL